jgi:hypothetical protein
MKKTIKLIGLITFTSAMLTGCGPNQEEKAKACNCDDFSQKEWYDQGARMGNLAKIASDGKRDCDWAKNFAINEGGELISYPADEEKYGDCWNKGFLESYDKKE